jgi:hypothetical protein
MPTEFFQTTYTNNGTNMDDVKEGTSRHGAHANAAIAAAIQQRNE